MEPLVNQKSESFEWSEFYERPVPGFKDCGPYRRSGVVEYSKRASRPNDRWIYHGHVAKVLEEQGFYVEEDPRSVYDPEQLWQQLERFGPSQNTFVQVDEHVSKGIALAWKVFGKPEEKPFLTPLEGEDELLMSVDLGKSAGLPFFGKKKDSYDYAFRKKDEVVAGKSSPPPCIAYARTQAGNKTRLVWGFPFCMTLLEGQFARPLINRYLRRRTTMAFGLKRHELGAYLHSEIAKSGGIPYSLDYSKFDASIATFFIRAAFNILGSWFTEEDRKRLGWVEMVNYFINTPIVMPNGRLYKGKDHGVPSGSYFTQMVDSIVNTMLIGAMLHAFNQQVHWKKIFILGDDVIFPMYQKIDSRRIAAFLRKYGVTVNAEKSKYGEVHFLGATWHKGAPDAPIPELIKKAVSPETFRKKPENMTNHKFALLVLSSYASNYLSGSYLLPIEFGSEHYAYYDSLDFSSSSKFLSGSDRFREEHSSAMRNKRPSKYSTLDGRFWS